MAKVGRPSIYTSELVTELCDRLASGESLRKICDDEHMPDKSTVIRWLFEEDKPEFYDQYAKARMAQCELMADELLEIADDSSKDVIYRTDKDGNEYEVANSEYINRSRLRVDTRKWVMSRLLRHRYGEKVEVEHKGSVVHNHTTAEEIPFSNIREKAEKRLDS